MREFKLQIPKQIIAIVVVLIFGFFLFADKLFDSEPYFPDLPAGAYVGEISGIGSNQSATIYAERLDGINALLLVVFKEGWKPKIHQLRKLFSEEENAETIQWKPLKIKFDENSFSLSGAAQSADFSGMVSDKENVIGKWTLEKIEPSELRRDVLASAKNFSLAAWLKQKGIYRSLREEEESLDLSITSGEEKLQKLEAYVAEGAELRARARARREELEESIQTLKAKRSEKLSELKQYVREIEQLDRITKKGRTIELARRVSKRENKWYLVHWQQGMDLSALEESLAVSLNVDLRKLNVQVERAREIESLRHSIALEQSRIRKLKEMYRRKIEGPPKKSPEEKQKPEQPWWKRWDTVFG